MWLSFLEESGWTLDLIGVTPHARGEVHARPPRVG
jgi:hypothetical protein